MSDTRAFKLSTGEEIITTVADTIESAELGPCLIIERPRIVMIAQHPETGQLMPQLIPFSAVNPNGSLTLKIALIMAEMRYEDIPKALTDAYTQSTTSIELVTG